MLLGGALRVRFWNLMFARSTYFQIAISINTFYLDYINTISPLSQLSANYHRLVRSALSIIDKRLSWGYFW
jgi:hypothetical protein